MDLTQARKIIALEERAKGLAVELGQISRELNKLGYEAKLFGFDWDNPGERAVIAPQGQVGISIEELSTRPSRQ